MKQSTDEIEISLPDILHSIWDVRWVLVVLSILGGIAGTMFSTGSQTSYETKASMLVTARAADGTYQNGSGTPASEDIYLSQNLTKTVQYLSTSNRVLKQVLEEEELSHINTEELKERIEVSAGENTAFLWFTLSWEDEAQAVKILNRLMEVLPDIMLEVMDIGSVNVIDTAEQAVMIQKQYPMHIGVGILAGLVLGCAIGIVYYLFVPKIRGNNSLELLDMDLIGEIPVLEHKKGKTPQYLDEENLPLKYQESYGRLAAVFRYMTERENKRIVAVTSSMAGEGKSTVAYNLAFRLNELGCKVLLLDFDFKKGVLYQFVKTRKPKDGDVRTELRNGEQLDKLVERMYNGIYTIQGFSEKDIFHAENKIFPAIRNMLETYDYILIDTPPVGILSDVQQMRGLMDGVLFVVRQDMVSLNMVTEAVTYLEKSGIAVIGAVLNCKKTFIEDKRKYRN